MTDANATVYTGRGFNMTQEQGGPFQVNCMPVGVPDGGHGKTAMIVAIPPLAATEIQSAPGIKITQWRSRDPLATTVTIGPDQTPLDPEEPSSTVLELEPDHGPFELIRNGERHSFSWDGKQLTVRTTPVIS